VKAISLRASRSAVRSSATVCAEGWIIKSVIRFYQIRKHALQ